MVFNRFLTGSRWIPLVSDCFSFAFHWFSWAFIPPRGKGKAGQCIGSIVCFCFDVVFALVFIWFSLASVGYLWLSLAFCGFSLVFIGSLWLSLVFCGFHWCYAVAPWFSLIFCGVS
jgi:hypothetical protein